MTGTDLIIILLILIWNVFMTIRIIQLRNGLINHKESILILDNDLKKVVEFLRDNK